MNSTATPQAGQRVGMSTRRTATEIEKSEPFLDRRRVRIFWFYWFLDRAGIYGSGKAFNFSSHKDSRKMFPGLVYFSESYFATVRNGFTFASTTEMFDLLFRLAQVERTAVGDGHTQLSTVCRRQAYPRLRLSSSVIDHSSLLDLRQRSVRTVGIELQTRQCFRKDCSSGTRPSCWDVRFRLSRCCASLQPCLRRRPAQTVPATVRSARPYRASTLR